MFSPFICQLNHVAFDRLKSHASFSGPALYKRSMYFWSFNVSSTVLISR